MLNNKGLHTEPHRSLLTDLSNEITENLCVPGTVPGAVNTAVNDMVSLTSCSLHSSGRR